jgi:hypothetical protein
VFGFLKSKKAEVLSHWYTPVPNYNASAQEFYTAVEKELEAQKVPGLEISRVEFAEGGVLSDKRTYLRMTRERLVFDICAAPFGINYFYSCRFAELPVKVNLFAVAILLFILLVVSIASWRYMGFNRTCFIGAVLLALVGYALRNLVRLGLANVDAALLKLPLFGTVYERCFRKETYYRHDTRLMYLTVVEGIVKKLVEQETAAKGVKLVTQYEYAPILGDLYKARPFGTGEKREAA